MGLATPRSVLDATDTLGAIDAAMTELKTARAHLASGKVDREMQGLAALRDAVTRIDEATTAGVRGLRARPVGERPSYDRLADALGMSHRNTASRWGRDRGIG